MQKVLLIEDEPNIRELVTYNLKQNNYEPLAAEDGETGLAMVWDEKPDLILLDIMLPGKSGYDICRELREKGNNVPIIMLTARNEEVDKILGLEFGADDYIAKPFSTRELIARVKAVLRRSPERDLGLGAAAETGSGSDSQGKGGEPDNEESAGGRITVGTLTIDPHRHEVKVGERRVELTLKEFYLLKTLAENRGIVFTRDQLLDKIWGFDYIGETRTVDVHVRYIRKKLGDDEKEGRFIQTVRGVGYKMP